jgi:hypothetical protein
MEHNIFIRNNFAKIKNFLSFMGVDFIEKSENEIIIPHIVDSVSLEENAEMSDLTMLEIINHSTMKCVADEGHLHILYDEKSKCLNFLTVVEE